MYSLDKTILSENDIKQLYNENMIFDFPKDELKPLNHILSLVEQDVYICQGYFSKNEMKSYSFFAKEKEDDSCCLLDFFAVNSKYRDKGIGSDTIKLLNNEKEFSEDGIIAEIEDPKYSLTSEERAIKEKRANFYYRNGFIKTDITSICFGVHFLIIYLPKKVHLSNNLIANKLNNIYKTIFPKSSFEKNISIFISKSIKK